MLDLIGGVIQLRRVRVSSSSMGPCRRSLRVAAQHLVNTLASKAASRLITPQGVLNISERQLKHLVYPRANSETEVEELSGTSEDETASEEFHVYKLALNVDRARRKLKFSPKSLNMDDYQWNRGTDVSVRARSVRTKVKLEPDDDVVKEPRRRNSKARVSPVKIEKAEDVMDDHNATRNGIVKQEAKEEAVSAPYHQHTEIDDVLGREPREDGRSRRGEFRSHAFAKVKKEKVEEDQEMESDRELDDIGKIPSPRVFRRRKRKSPEQDFSGASTAKKASDRKLARQIVKGTAFGREVGSVSPGSGARLSSAETASAITVLAGPYPTYARPFPEECQQARDLLSTLHGRLPEYERYEVSCPTIEQHVNMQLALTTAASSEVGSRPKVLVPKGHSRDRRGVLDSLIGTLLAQNTTDNNARRAFGSLKSAFPTWEEVLRADPKVVEDAIRHGGLAKTKAERIRTILGTLLKERGELSMEYIRSMSNEDIKEELSRFKGIGPKTVACVLMFHLHRKEFPVDTHVFRISQMLGWVPEQADREKAYLHLNQRIPDALKYDIHCLFVTHGKRCPKCAKRFNRQPSDGDCPLLNWKSKWSTKSNPPLELKLASDQLEDQVVL